jgi:putative redox protein
MGDWREITIDWCGGSAFLGTNATGSKVQMGSFGEQAGLSPMELVLAALGGCTGVDIASILDKKRQPLKELRLVVRGKRAESHPRKYTEIEVKYLLWGDGLNEEAVRQAIALSEEKYCSVSAMLKTSVTIRLSYQIMESSDH